MRLDELISLLDEWWWWWWRRFKELLEYFETGQVWRDNLPFKEGGKKQKIRSGIEWVEWDGIDAIINLSTPSSSWKWFAWKLTSLFKICWLLFLQDLAKLYEVLEQARSPTGPGEEGKLEGDFWKRRVFGDGKRQKQLSQTWEFRTTPPPRMPVTTQDYSIFQFFSRESQAKPLWELMLCSPAFELSMFWWFEMFSRTFSGQAWRDGVWSICWEGVTRWGDGFFQEAFKV